MSVFFLISLFCFTRLEKLRLDTWSMWGSVAVACAAMAAKMIPKKSHGESWSKVEKLEYVGKLWRSGASWISKKVRVSVYTGPDPKGSGPRGAVRWSSPVRT